MTRVKNPVTRDMFGENYEEYEREDGYDFSFSEEDFSLDRRSEVDWNVRDDTEVDDWDASDNADVEEGFEEE